MLEIQVREAFRQRSIGLRIDQRVRCRVPAPQAPCPLGLTQIQSMPAAGIVPLVLMATVKPRARLGQQGLVSCSSACRR